MNDLESRLSAAFHTEADELSAAVDLPRAAVELESRLDRLERDRHRRTWVIGLAAVAAIALAVLVGVRLAAPHIDTEPVSPTTSYTSQGFVVPFTANVPDWAAAHAPVLTEGRKIGWQGDQCWTDCSAGQDVKLIAFAPQVAYGATAADRLVIPSAQGYLDHLGALQDAHVVALSGSHSAVVDGHAATVLDVVASTAVTAGIGCAGSGVFNESEPTCWSFVPGTRVHLAVIDADTQPYYGSGFVTPPLLVLLRTADADSTSPTYVADVDRMLATMKIPAPPTPTYTSRSSVMPFSIVLPPWAEATPPSEAASGRLVTWELSCEPAISGSAADCAHPARVFGLTSPLDAGGSDPLGRLSDDPRITVVGQFSPLLVDGRPTQVGTLTTEKDVPLALGCEAPGSCTALAAGTTTRVAEITEQGKPPLIVWQSWTTGAPGTTGLAADFDAALQSIRFDT